MDETSGPSHINDDFAQAADGVGSQVEAATSGVERLSETLGELVDNGITSAEKSLDGFLDGLDKLLGKF